MKPIKTRDKLAVLALLWIVLFAGYWVGTTREPSPFRLAKPKPATIRELGEVKPPPAHPCDAGFAGECFDYVGGWCQAPCATYRVPGTLVSVERISDRALGLYLLVLRDGDVTIAGRAMRKPTAHVGDRVRVSGVLFFPRPRDRDGQHLPNGAELSPVLSVVPV